MFKILLSVLLFSTTVHANCDGLFEKTPGLLNLFSLEKGHYPDFRKVKTEEFLPALKIAINRAKDRINKITMIRPTFKSVILGLEDATAEVDKIADLFGTYEEAYSSTQLEDIRKEFNSLVTSFIVWKGTNEALFKQIEIVYQQRKGLTEAQQRLLKDYYMSFVMGGAQLAPADKRKFKTLKQKLSDLRVQFDKNLKKIEKETEFVLTEKDLVGLPDDVRNDLSELAKSKGKTGYIANLDQAIVISILTYSDNEELKKQIFLAFNRRGYKSGETDNSKLVYEIEEVSQKIARLLGYENAADQENSLRMTKTVKNVYDLLKKLVDTYKPFALKEEKELADFAKSKNGLYNPWNRHFYWPNRLQQERDNFDKNKIKEYFSYDPLLKAALKLSSTLYEGITYIQRDDLPKPHPDVAILEVKDKEETIAYLLVDPFSRSGTKQGGGSAWAGSLTRRYKHNGKKVPGVFTINMNYTKPTAGKPALLTLDEARTLLHEFGHSLHNILSEVEYRSQSGTLVKRDIVELPSQFMEEYLYQREFLNWFAYNSEGEHLPEDLYQAILKEKSFRVASFMMRQLGFSLLDMAWFTGIFRYKKGSIAEIEKEILAPITLLPHNEDTAFSTSFRHIFMGGYTAGYYSYKHADIYVADLFYNHFVRMGIFNPNMGDRFRRFFLAVGDAKDPAEAYRMVTDTELDFSALLKRDGLIQ